MKGRIIKREKKRERKRSINIHGWEYERKSKSGNVNEVLLTKTYLYYTASKKVIHHTSH